MKTYFYDLTKIYAEEVEPPAPPAEEGFPFWILIIIIIVAALLGYYLWKTNLQPKKAAPEDVKVVSPPTTSQAVQPGQVVDAEMVAESAAPE